MNTFSKVLFFVFISLQVTASYPVAMPNHEGYLQVSEQHRIFYATYGNPEGIPVVVLHGGPGMGCNDTLSRFFDLGSWHVIMFDQRGVMRSTPPACMEENTTQHLVRDIEMLKQHLGIEKWVVFGGSWGSCLGLLYGQEHPESCLGFILRGIFLGRDQDIQMFKDAGKYSLDAYYALLTHFSVEEQKGDLLSICYQKIMNPDAQVHMEMARALMQYSLTNTKSPPNRIQVEKTLQNDRFVLCFMRTFLHYALHSFFLEPDQILAHMDQIAHFPAVLVHGSLDEICALTQAEELHAHWPNSQLVVIKGAGHSSDEPRISDALMQATDHFAKDVFNPFFYIGE